MTITISKKELTNNVMRYTVKLDNLKSGTITIIEDDYSPQVGELHKNVHFIDNFGNNMSRDGFVQKILKTEVYHHGFKECEIID
jgi:hypothetical protein